MSDTLHNWAGNYTYHAPRRHAPGTVDEVRALVKACTKVRALGTRHCFNAIADTDGDLISTEGLNRIVKLDRERRQVTIEAGVTYGQLGPYLHGEGFALPNLASLPHISVAGACATATHGSGVANSNLATSVAAMEIVTADGDVTTLSREGHGEAFDGTVVHLGALGVVTKLTLDLAPAFNVAQSVYENLPWGALEENFDAIVSAAYSVSLFTDWQRGQVDQVWLKRRVGEGDAPSGSFFGATPAPVDRHPLIGLPAENCTAQCDVPGPWYERLPHFRLAFTPSAGEELQAEYFVARRDAVAALRAVAQLREKLAPALFISEIRTVASDTLWLSPCYQRDSVGIHFTLRRDEPAVLALLPQIEDALAPFDPRPHWGKLFTMDPARLQSRYAKLADFRRLMRRYDPAGKFRNAFLELYVPGR